ncbi:LOW QUALITY PROTEIN: reverse transcriptase [Phytophthora megakarya]|uniref:Reverse transcriptase n=1 Tax=Phytophthora megakarya TaxID=4795 RepID=A0A225WJZ3_9STRA|nr:LOW QUALITY PROTEIN: reverse transcriptase [Phytophthora megakarya]
MTERREYVDPQAILGRSKKPGNPQGEHHGRKVEAISTVSREDNTESTDRVQTRDAPSPKLEYGTRLGTEHGHGPDSGEEPKHGSHLKIGSTEEPDPGFKDIPEYQYVDEEVIFHEGSRISKSGVWKELTRRKLQRWKKRKWLIGKDNALPPAAKGVICDIDVGNARPVAQCVRKNSSQSREKLADLIRGLLSARKIRAQLGASRIAIIVKKNGVDIRLCVDYSLVNGLTQWMVYPMPLVTDLLEDLDMYRWNCSLDVASGFWVVPMTDRASLISEFITPFGLFEWLRMAFGLCNVPQIYQRLIDNALYGFWKLSPTDDARNIFKDGVPSKPGTHGGKAWDDLFEKVERLLEVCEDWHLSISVEKSEWGMSRVDYLGHEVSGNGLGAKPMNLEALAALDFPRTLKLLQSFLCSLNYYHRFIPDFAIFATPLYSLSARDFEERATNPETRDVEVWDYAERALTTLRSKIAATPMLKHFAADRQPVAVSAVLIQEHGGVYMPVKFTSRTLKPNKLNYSITEKEILALLRVLNECHNILVGKTIRVLTRHTTLGWLFRSKGLQGRLSPWAAILSPWQLEILRSVKGEEAILGALAVSITTRTNVDSALEDIAPRTRPSKTATISVLKIGPTESPYVISFDGSARVKREGGAFSAVAWQLLNWDVVKAASGYAEGLTVSEVDYRGMLLGLSLLEYLDVARLIICDDLNLVMDCKCPGLKQLRQQAWNALRERPEHEFLHVRRDWNASTDMLAGQTFQRQGGKNVHSVEGIEDLKTLNRLREVLQPTLPVSELETRGTDDPVAEIKTRGPDNERRGTGRVCPVTTWSIDASRQITRRQPEPLLDQVRTTQDEELWIANLKKFLSGDISELSKQEVKSCVKIAEQYEVGESGLLYYYVRGDESTEARDRIMKLVASETLRQDVLHHYHASLEGGHQGIGRTYQRVRRHFHWPGLFKSVQRHVGECVDCETGKDRPTIQGESPGNIVATYPFQVVAMDHIPSLPASHKGNTELLIWVDLFTGFVIAKASASRTVQTVAESYEEAVFRRFGASETIHHDREPGFMSDFFKAFNKPKGQRQRETLVYRPQANGAAERMVQTITRAIEMNIADNDQRDWDVYAERLTYALNTTHD